MIQILFKHLMSKLENQTVKNDSIAKEEEESEIRDENSIPGKNMQAINENQSDLESPKNEFTAKIKTAEAMEGNINDVFTLEADDREYFACVKDLKWQLISGDKIHVVGGWSDNEFQVTDVKPMIKKEFEYGRVSSLSFHKGYAIFEGNILLLFSTLSNINCSLKIHEEYKFEAIESDQKFDGRSFDFRVVNVIEKVQSKISGRGILFQNDSFKITLNPEKADNDIIISRFINVRNISQKPVDLMTVEAVAFDTDGDGIVVLDMAGRSINYNIARNGTFKVYFRIQPLKVGKFGFKLTANFGEFEETFVFTVEISKSYVVNGPKLRTGPRFVDIRIGEYPVPSDLKEIDYTKVNSAIEELNEKYPFLTATIDSNNYLDKMRHGIYFEEIALEKSFTSYRQENAIFETKNEFLRLAVKDLAEMRPSIIVGDKVLATDPHRNDTERPVFEGVIHKLENDSILVKFHNDFHSNHHEKNYTVEFTFSRTTFRRQQHSLDLVTSENGLGYDFLFPNLIEPKSPQVNAKIEDKILIVNDHPRKWFNNTLNEYQKNAVVNVLRGENRPLPYIFFGCPGSGKTQTVIETILQIHTHVLSSRILVATPSNSAANLITEMLINSNVLDQVNPQFIRLVSNNQVAKDLIPDNLSKYCATVNIAVDENQHFCEYERNKVKGTLGNVTKNKILDFRIVIATLNCFGSLLQMKLDNAFSHVLIDEAGQSVEPETLIPLTLLNKTKGQCILAGDPNQLGPILISRCGSVFKFNFSMLERLLLNHPYYQQTYGHDKNEYDSKFVTKLKKNYRALPSLLKVYNNLFYNGELESEVDEKSSVEALLMSNADSFLWKNTNKNCSVFFVNVANGRNRKIKDSCSWYNEEEIRAVMSFLHKCSSCKIPFKDIGIVSPYLLQVKKMKHQVAVGTSDTDLKIGTVEEFQGQERLIIIVSTVRTEAKFASVDHKFGLGFLQCPKRCNVAISRAKALLVVFGKEEILTKDENWKYLINYAKENRTYVSDKF